MEELFRRYVSIQYSGVWNMITEARAVMEVGEISFDDYCYIQEHYKELKEKFPKTWEMAKNKGEKLSKEIYG